MGIKIEHVKGGGAKGELMPRSGVFLSILGLIKPSVNLLVSTVPSANHVYIAAIITQVNNIHKMPGHDPAYSMLYICVHYYFISSLEAGIS